MKKGLLLFSLIILILPIVLAQNVQIDDVVINAKVQPGGTAEFELKIWNNQAYADNFKISPAEFDVFPFSNDVKSVMIADEFEYVANIPSNTVRTIPVKITISEEARPNNNYLVHFNIESSQTKKKYQHEMRIGVIAPENLVEINSNLQDKVVPGKGIRFKLSMSSNANVLLDSVDVVVLSELFEERFSTPIFFKKISEKDVTFDLDSDVKPGTYSLSVKAYQNRKVIGVYNKNFEVIKNPDIEEVIQVSKSFMKEKTNLQKTNVGNLVVQESFVYPVTALSKLFTKTSPEADLTQSNSLIWNFELKPNQTYEVNIDVNYMSLFIFIIVVVFILLFLVYRYSKKIYIKKSALRIKESKEGFSELKVQIHIKNKDTRVRNVEVYDIVPNMVNIIGEYGTIKPDKVQDGARGKRLVWRINELARGEERIISYRIQTKIGIVGKLVLPATVVRYKRGNSAYEFKSNNIVFHSHK